LGEKRTSDQTEATSHFDLTETLDVHCINGFQAPCQSSCLSGYNARS
jgi:hypothetical protein